MKVILILFYFVCVMPSAYAQRVMIIRINAIVKKNYIFTPRDIFTARERLSMNAKEQRERVYQNLNDGEIFCSFDNTKGFDDINTVTVFVGIGNSEDSVLTLHRSRYFEQDWMGSDLSCERLIKPYNGQIRTTIISISGVNLDKVTNGEVQIVK